MQINGRMVRPNLTQAPEREPNRNLAKIDMMTREQITPPSSQSDEIDLFALMMTLWRRKGLIFGITLLFTLIAAGISLLITPTYRTESILKPVNPNELYALNDLGVYSVTSEGLFKRVEGELRSYSNQEQFFRQHQSYFAPIINNVDEERLEQVISRFANQNLKIKQPGKDETQEMLILEFTYPKGVIGPEALNQYVSDSIKNVKAEIPQVLTTRIDQEQRNLQNQLAVLLAGYNAKIDSEIANLTEKDQLKRLQLQDELKALKEALKKERENRIATLTEAIEIAERLGYRKPTSPSSESSREQSSSVIYAEINQEKMPLYFLGTEALKAERNTLLARESDDFTSTRITEIEQELRLLENNRKIELLKLREKPDLFLDEITTIKQKIAELNIAQLKIENQVLPHLATLDIVEVDEKAIAPLSPLKPNKKLITIIGFLLGGMLGIIIVLLQEAIGNYRARKINKA